MGLSIGTLYVRRSIFIEKSPERVWDEFGSFERLKTWFGLGQQLHAFQPTLGSEVRLSIEIDGEPKFFGGKLLVYDEGKELSFENNWEGLQTWPVPTFITLRLTGLYEGSLVEIFHHGFERLGSAAAENLQGYEQGWDSHHLDALRAIVED